MTLTILKVRLPEAFKYETLHQVMNVLLKFNFSEESCPVISLQFATIQQTTLLQPLSRLSSPNSRDPVGGCIRHPAKNSGIQKHTNERKNGESPPSLSCLEALQPSANQRAKNSFLNQSESRRHLLSSSRDVHESSQDGDSFLHLSRILWSCHSTAPLAQVARS